MLLLISFNTALNTDEVTWWRGCSSSDRQLWSGAVSEVGRVVHRVQL